MTLLAVNAALLEIPFDTGRLFNGDTLYMLWLSEVVEQVAQERSRQARALGL